MKLMLTDSRWFFQDRLDVLGRHVSLAGVTAFVICVGIGLLISTLLQSERMRQVLSRFHLDKSLANITTSLLGLAAFAGLVVLGIGFAGIPIPWGTPVPGIGLSALQAASLIVW